MASSAQRVSELLRDWAGGQREALDRLVPLVYDELRRIARYHLHRLPPGQTLQTTALVHEAYLRLAGQQEGCGKDRAHFVGIAANLMRCILVDHIRSSCAAKRGGGQPHVSLDETATFSDQQAADLIAIDDALHSLARIDPRKSRIVDLRFFGGLSVEETAEVLNLSTATVKREWRMARAWLHREVIRGTPASDPPASAP